MQYGRNYTDLRKKLHHTRFDAAGACVVQAPEDGCHKQQQQRQEAAHVDVAAARSVVMPLSRAAAVCVTPPCHL